MTSPLVVVPHIRSVDVRLEGERVLLIVDGRRVLDVPCGEVADQLARAIMAQSRRGEEIIHAERIAFDYGLLLRKGIPIGLTNNPKIQEMGAKEAAWNRDLRRALPGGVKSQEHFGTPAVIRHAPPKEQHEPK